ncbi:MAG TPA: hypothetical protein VLW55_20640 [Burkholderiaceae bacterium]|nr:hypothetical protein [Burkholderiaceae bacterium]
MLKQMLKDHFCPLEHVVVPEANDSESVLPKPCIACRVSFILHMLPAIDFDDESRSQTHEVDHVGAERLLTLELETRETARAEMAPQQRLGVRGVRA